MSILKKTYEISLWEDEWDGTKFVEKRIMTIGSDTMEFQGRALEPKLVRKTNGEVNFSFKMYYTYIDTFTGNKVDNPFVNCIVNESKIKLKYGNEWFDLLVKNIAKDSNNKTYSYTLVNQHVTELSKNGYDLILDTSLMNNVGTLSELGETVVENSGWSVEAEPITQTIEEPLVTFLIPAGGVTAYRINDKNLTADGAIATNQGVTIQGGARVYVFYSCCSGGKPYRFQFICAPDALKKPEELKGRSPDYSNFTTGSDRVIRDIECQYYIDNIVYNSAKDSAGIDGPEGWSTTYPEEGNNSPISIQFRGKRYVYSEISDFHVGLNQYLTRYNVEVDGDKLEAYKYTKTNYIVPTIIQNYITGADFATVNGWKGSKFNDAAHADTKFNPNIEVFRNRYTEDYDGTEATGVYIDSVAEACRGVDVAGKTYTNQLLCSNLGAQEGLAGKNKTVINTGPYDFRNHVTAFSVNEEYILNFTYAYISQIKGADYYDYEKCDSLPFEFRVSNFQISGELNGYSDGLLANPENNSLFYCTDNAVWNDSTKDFTIQTTVKSLKTLSKSQFLSDKYQVFLNFDGIAEDTEDKKYYILIKQLEFYKKIPKQGGGYYTLNETVEIDSDSTYQEEVRYFECIKEDTRTEEDIVFLPGNITNAIPKLSDKAEKRTSINIKQSNYYNAVQTLAEAFQCWATIIVPHDDNGNIIGEKTIKFQNYIGQPNNAGFRYGINSKNITRTLESKDLVSKLMVKANNNQFATNGFCAISRATANSLKENTMYNFDYYVNQKLMEGKVLQSNLYIPDTELTESNAEDYYTNPIGYYAKLGEINRQMDRINNLLSQRSIPLIQAQKDVTTNELGWQAAEEASVTAKESFYKIAGFDYNRFPRPNLLLGSNNRKESTKINVGTYTWANSTPLSKHRRNSSSPEYIGLNRNGHSYVCTIDCTPSADYSWIALVQGNWSDNPAQNTERMLSGWKEVTGGRRQTIVINIPATSTTETAIDNPTESDYQAAKKMWVAQRQGAVNQESPGEGGTAEGMVIHYIKIEEVTSAADEQPTAWVAAAEEGGISGAEKVRGSMELTGLLTEISMALCSSSIFKTQYEAAKALLETLEESYAELEEQLDMWQERKEKINKAFTQLYSRFIQEGTWIDESYMDDNLYYLGAQSVLYNSTMPKVSYSINVISLSGLPRYEIFDFKIGDQTFIEDIEFFGYELDGVTPYQEQITITETTENLDDPSKNSIKVQNYENQFADLFQRITATVQSVQYSEGSYQKAAELASGDIKYKTAFLQEALESVDTEISNAAADSVTLGKEGLVIENTNNGTGIRLIDGGLYLKSRNKDGSVTWKTGITADGISANLITAGQIDTSVLQIMNGKQPTFRWDSHGLTAYGFNNSDSDIFLNNVDTTRGVRFDRFGLYGYSGIDGATWHPQSISDEGDSVANIEDKSTFYLTWEGLKVKTKNGGTLRIGDNSKVTGEDDTSILTVTNKDGVIGLKIDENGNLNIGGSGGRVGQFILEDNKMNIYMSDIGSMNNLYYGTQEFTGDRWENLSAWEISGTSTDTNDLYATQQRDSNGNLKIRRKDAWGGTYQKFYAEKNHLYRCSARISFCRPSSSQKQDSSQKLNMSIRSHSGVRSAYLDLPIIVPTTYTPVINNWERSAEYTVCLYFLSPLSEYVSFFPARFDNRDPNYFEDDAYMEISSLCVTEFDGSEWQKRDSNNNVETETVRYIENYEVKENGVIVTKTDDSTHVYIKIKSDFIDKQYKLYDSKGPVEWAEGPTSNDVTQPNVGPHYGKGYRCYGYAEESLWQDNTSDKATIQFVVEGYGDQISELNIKSNQMVARVCNGQEGAGWDLSSNAFSVGVYKDNDPSSENTNLVYDEKIRVDSTGLTVKGHLETETGKIGDLVVDTKDILYPGLASSEREECNLFNINSLVGYVDLDYATSYTSHYGLTSSSKAYLEYEALTRAVQGLINKSYGDDKLLCWPCNITELKSGVTYSLSAEVQNTGSQDISSLVFGFIAQNSALNTSAPQPSIPNQDAQYLRKIMSFNLVKNSKKTCSISFTPTEDIEVCGFVVQNITSYSGAPQVSLRCTKIMLKEGSSTEYGEYYGDSQALIINHNNIDMGYGAFGFIPGSKLLKTQNLFVGQKLVMGNGLSISGINRKKLQAFGQVTDIGEDVLTHRFSRTALLNSEDFSSNYFSGSISLMATIIRGDGTNQTYEGKKYSLTVHTPTPPITNISGKVFIQWFINAYLYDPNAAFPNPDQWSYSSSVMEEHNITLYSGQKNHYPLTFGALEEEISTDSIYYHGVEGHTDFHFDLEQLEKCKYWSISCRVDHFEFGNNDVVDYTDRIFVSGNISTESRGQLIGWDLILPNGEILTEKLSAIDERLSQLGL